MKQSFIFFILLMHFAVKAQDFSAYEKKLFIKGTDTLPYRILYPENYDAKRTYPLVLFLHGRGECGNDNEKQLMHGANLFLNKENREKHPAIVIFPQCPESSYWSNVSIKEDSSGKRVFDFAPEGPPTIAMTLLEGLLQEQLHSFTVNKKQVYVTGLSMGGMGTFEIVRRNPKIFAAAMPICGGANAETAKKLKHTKWWIFHGAKDDVVNADFSQQMYVALTKAKAKVKFTLYPNANHNSWDSAFAEPDLLDWLFAQRK